MKVHRCMGAAGVVVLSALTLGCASGSGGGGARGTASILTADEIATWGSQDLYSAIQQLRPQWAQARKGVNFRERLPVTVVVEGVRMEGGVAALRRVPAGDVLEARLLSARDATTLYGIGNMSGAIVVKLKRGGK